MRLGLGVFVFWGLFWIPSLSSACDFYRDPQVSRRIIYLLGTPEAQLVIDSNLLRRRSLWPIDRFHGWQGAYTGEISLMDLVKRIDHFLPQAFIPRRSSSAFTDDYHPVRSAVIRQRDRYSEERIRGSRSRLTSLFGKLVVVDALLDQMSQAPIQYRLDRNLMKRISKAMVRFIEARPDEVFQVFEELMRLHPIWEEGLAVDFLGQFDRVRREERERRIETSVHLLTEDYLMGEASVQITRSTLENIAMWIGKVQRKWILSERVY